jgi:hypothetical protein
MQSVLQSTAPNSILRTIPGKVLRALIVIEGLVLGGGW